MRSIPGFPYCRSLLISLAGAKSFHPAAALMAALFDEVGVETVAPRGAPPVQIALPTGDEGIVPHGESLGPLQGAFLDAY